MKRSLSEYEDRVPICECGYLCETKYQNGLKYVCPRSSKRCKFTISKFKWQCNTIRESKEVPQDKSYSGTYYLPKDIWKEIIEYLPVGYSFKTLPLLNKSWKSIIDDDRRRVRLFAEIDKTFGSRNVPQWKKANFVIAKTMMFSFVDEFLTMCVSNMCPGLDEKLFENVLFSKYDVLLNCVRADSKEIFNKVGNSYLSAVAMKGENIKTPNFQSPAIFRVEINKNQISVFRLDSMLKLCFPSVNFSNKQKQYFLLIVDKKSQLPKYKCNTASIQSLYRMVYSLQ